MKISDIYVKLKSSINDEYVAKVADDINKRIKETIRATTLTEKDKVKKEEKAIGVIAFTERDRDNIIQHFERELENYSPDIRASLKIAEAIAEYSNLFEITGTKIGLIEYKDNNYFNILICNWYLDDNVGIPYVSPGLELIAHSETLTAEYLGDCDDIYQELKKVVKDKDRILIFNGVNDLKLLDKIRGKKYHIYANGKLKATIYAPDGWN